MELIDDKENNPDKEFMVMLDEPKVISKSGQIATAGESHYHCKIRNKKCTIVIIDDDKPGKFSFS